MRGGKCEKCVFIVGAAQSEYDVGVLQLTKSQDGVETSWKVCIEVESVIERQDQTIVMALSHTRAHASAQPLSILCKIHVFLNHHMIAMGK